MDVLGAIRHNNGMATVVEQKRDQIIALAEQYGVQELYAFGSATRDDFVEGKSDVDFLVRFKPCELHQRRRRYFDLIYALEEVFGTHVDLIEIDAIKNPYFKTETEASRQLVYAS